MKISQAYREPAAPRIQTESPTLIIQLVHKLPVIPLVLVSGNNLQDAEAIRQILNNAYVVEVHFEFRQVVVQVHDFDLHSSHSHFEGVVDLGRLDLQDERIPRQGSLSVQIDFSLEKQGAVHVIQVEEVPFVSC